MIFIKERIGRLIKDVEALVYPYEVKIDSYKIKKTCDRFCDISQIDTSDWEELHKEEIWGGNQEYFWFETFITIPDEWDGRCVAYEVMTGREGQWDAVNPQFSVFVDGRLKQGFDVNHRETILSEQARGGERHHIVLSAFTGDRNFYLKLDSRLKVLDRKVESYYYDLKVPYDTALLLDEPDREYMAVIKSLNDSLNLLDLRKEGSDAFYASLAVAHDRLRKDLYEKQCGQTEVHTYCVGHTHIDCAWQWTLKVTRDKAVRSFSTALELMRRYPEFIFMSSQPQLYQYVKEEAPEVYEEIKRRVREGRWETEGGMFVEADCNLASGESLIRQFLYGTRFFRREFGTENVILWLPDVFGYSAALPQIMKKCKIRYFMTTKLSWNEFNKMPYDTFMWEGIDGTAILTHFSPTRDYHTGGREDGNENSHYTTYNGFLCPSQVKGGWERYSPKYLNKEVLMCFGYGDGGGGATSQMLENQRRISKGIPGCHATVMSTARHFFETLEEHVSGSSWLPKWTGELYLEYHRGTYTSMARNKRYNRKAEFATQDTEFLAVCDGLISGAAYPREELDSVWEAVLRNQFHDILPGSSIKEVYDDSKEEYEKLLAEDSRLMEASLKRLVSAIDAPEGALAVYNFGPEVKAEVVEFYYEGGWPVVYDGERKVSVQKSGERTYIFTASGLPERGYKTYGLGESEVGDGSKGNPMFSVSEHHLENRYFSIRLNSKGQFAGILDKTAGRELLMPGKSGNVIMSYEDRPHKYDAWDINNYYEEKSWEVDQVECIEVTEHGPVRACVTVTRRYLDSTIKQSIYLYHDIPRIDIRNQIEWKEHQIFLKTLFPLDIHTSEAVFDIQYGNVKRPTHANTSWDFARFEVCVHKWLDLGEDDYGVSFINDCKYGCSVRDSVVGLSMLKSGTFPNPQADQEYHEFTYSIYPHKGSWKEAGSVHMAYQMNNPPAVVRKEQGGGFLDPVFSFFSTDCPNVIIEAVKREEDGEGIILRLYECFNRRTKVILRSGLGAAEAYECSMLEEIEQALAVEKGQVRFTIKPYEIKTILLRCSGHGNYR